MVVDYERVVVARMTDKASPGNRPPSLIDRWRTSWILRGRNIEHRDNVVCKQGVEVSVCNTGRLVIGEHSFLHARVWILMTKPAPQVTIGRWVFIGRNTIIAAKRHISIGDYTIFAPNCYVVDQEHGFAPDDIILNQTSVLKEVHIGKDCYFGTGTVILGGVTVGDGAVIGAGSIVKQNIPSGEIWAGNPARFIRKR